MATATHVPCWILACKLSTSELPDYVAINFSLHFSVPEETADAVKEMLMRNFERAYNGKTRAPFGLYMHCRLVLRIRMEIRRLQDVP